MEICIPMNVKPRYQSFQMLLTSDKTLFESEPVQNLLLRSFKMFELNCLAEGGFMYHLIPRSLVLCIIFPKCAGMNLPFCSDILLMQTSETISDSAEC